MGFIRDGIDFGSGAWIRVQICARTGAYKIQYGIFCATNLFSIDTAVVIHVHFRMYCTSVPLCNRKLFISTSCLILVLKTVLGRPRHADAKNGVENYHGSQENAMPKHSYSPYTFF